MTILLGLKRDDGLCLRASDNSLRAFNTAVQSAKNFGILVVPLLVGVVDSFLKYFLHCDAVGELFAKRKPKLNEWSAVADAFTKEYNLQHIDRIISAKPEVGDQLVKLLSDLETILCSDDVTNVPGPFGMYLRS